MLKSRHDNTIFMWKGELKWNSLQQEMVSESRKGSKNSNSRLTKEQVLEIHRKMNSGVNYKEVCAEYGIGQCWAYKC